MQVGWAGMRWRGKNMWVGLNSLAFLLWSLEIQELLSRAEEGETDMNIFVP